MKNYYELLKLIDDASVKRILSNDFNNDYVENYGKIQINNSTRKQARKAYFNKKYIRTDTDIKGLYCTPETILNIPEETEKHGTDCTIKTQALKMLKNRKPVDCYIRESIAIAKTIGWKPSTNYTKDKPYHININGSCYDISLVYDVFMAIADKKTDGGCTVEQSEVENGKSALILSSKYGLAVVLPTTLNLNPDYDCNFKHYIETEKALDEETAIPFN